MAAATATGGQAFAQTGSSYGTTPAPRPTTVRVHWSNIVALGGGAAMAVALLLVLTGIPTRVLYDADSPGKLTKPTSNPASITTAIDQNMRYMTTATGYEKGQYNYYLSSVDSSEDGLPAMADKLSEMSATVAEMDASLGRVLTITKTMSTDMQAMAVGAGNSAKTMKQLQADIATLNATMASMNQATNALVKAMGDIEVQAAGIGRQTGGAVRLTRELSGALPNSVPTPRTTLERDRTAQ